MNDVSPTRHVLIALTITALLFVVAGDQWSAGIARFKPVKVAPKS